VPLRRPEDVIPHLGERHHWRQGRSAKALADFCWETGALPPVVGALLAQSPMLAGAELLEAWLERENDLEDGRGRPSQTDLLALLGTGDQLAVLGVEAKTGEPFGPTVFARLKDGSAGPRARVEQLCRRLEIAPDAVGALRYQLLHRTVAALIEARRFRASRAVLLVQSFWEDPKSFADFRDFADAIGFPRLASGILQGPRRLGAIDLWIGWLESAVPACGLTISALRQTTVSSPSQWDGRLTDGRPIYIRYRWGQLSVHLGEGEDGARADDAAPWFSGEVNDWRVPDIDLPQVLRVTGLALSSEINEIP
jgi:hypothetical protein